MGPKVRITIYDCKKFAQSKNGKCLSSEYEYHKKLLWECEFGHQWETTYSNISKPKGTWCPYCSKKAKHKIEEFHIIAKERGGECLSDKYENIKSKLEFKCKDGHCFKQSGQKVMIGQWCPDCKISIGEEVVRCYFEKIFNKEFKKIRPHWLINEDGNQMELDGFCEELNLAFEHNGRQHEQDVKYFNMTGAKLEKRIKDDITKNELCKLNSVILITVPEIFSVIQLCQLKEFLKNKFIENNITVPQNYDDINVNINSLYMKTRNDEIEERLKDFIESKGGKLLSKYYSAFSKLTVQCQCGYVWEILTGNVLKGHWCPKCNGGVKHTVEKREEIMLKINSICKEKNGECLSDDYDDQDKKIELKCNKGHIWRTRYGKIIEGTWCPTCAGKNYNLDDAIKLADKKGGFCLSEEYISANDNLQWKCDKGHVWNAKFINIKKGTWCPYCAIKNNEGAKNIIKSIA